jgi:hypothetical protein
MPNWSMTFAVARLRPYHLGLYTGDMNVSEEQFDNLSIASC